MTPHYEWISVHEASRRLNKSVSTIRRMIEAGELVGEREPLGGSRERYRVRMPQEASGTPQTGVPPPSTPDAPETPQIAPDATAGLLAELRAMRQEHAAERAIDASRIADLRERVGRLEAERDAERARVNEMTSRLARPWWERLLGR